MVLLALLTGLLQKLHEAGAVLKLRYGMTPVREKQRLLHLAKIIALRKVCHREKEALRNSFTGSVDWSLTEMDENPMGWLCLIL
jgi:hypothetical protein